MVRTVEDQREEQVIMDMIAGNDNAPCFAPNEEDQREADSYLNMSGDGIEG